MVSKVVCEQAEEWNRLHDTASLSDLGKNLGTISIWCWGNVGNLLCVVAYHLPGSCRRFGNVGLINLMYVPGLIA